MQVSDSTYQATGINRSKNFRFNEYLERLNFLYLCEQFPEDLAQHTGNEIYKKLCRKYYR